MMDSCIYRMSSGSVLGRSREKGGCQVRMMEEQLMANSLEVSGINHNDQIIGMLSLYVKIKGISI